MSLFWCISHSLIFFSKSKYIVKSVFTRDQKNKNNVFVPSSDDGFGLSFIWHKFYSLPDSGSRIVISINKYIHIILRLVTSRKQIKIARDTLVWKTILNIVMELIQMSPLLRISIMVYLVILVYLSNDSVCWDLFWSKF